MPMNPQIKLRWVDALRSGEYVQGRAGLRNDSGYCCLGVLCELHRQAHPDREWEIVNIDMSRLYTGDVTGPMRYLGDTNILPDEVAEWAELDLNSPNVRYLGTNGQALTSLNDGGVPFTAIAVAIEDSL
jgi:hypothetical protein